MSDAGEVVHIFIAPKRGAPLDSVECVEAVRDRGLEGDRYTRIANRHTAHYQVTLIELEAIEAFTAATHLAMTPGMPRRNIVTRGIALNALVGQRFRVGAAILEGAELCEPCTLFAKRTHREVLSHFQGRGGLRARVIEGGAIRPGDPICGDDLNFRGPGESDMRAIAHDNHPRRVT